MPHAAKVTQLGMVGALNAGFSRKGQHINIAIDGAGDPTELLAGTSEDEIRSFFRSFFELRAITCDAESRRRRVVVRSLTIRDLNGVGMHLLKHTKAVMVLKRILGEALANYPESTSQVFFLNTPSMMSALWSVIKPMLSERSQAKCEFLGGEREYRSILLERAGMPLAAIATLYQLNNAGHTASSVAAAAAEQQQQQQVEEGSAPRFTKQVAARDTDEVRAPPPTHSMAMACTVMMPAVQYRARRFPA